MTEVVFWGGTGQAKVLHEALEDTPHRLVAIVDNRPIASPVPGVVMLHGEAGLRDFLARRPAGPPLHFAVAIGGDHGWDRLSIFDLLVARGLAPLTVIHPRAFAARSAIIDPGCQLLAQSSVCAEARLGHCVIVNTAATVDHDCVVGAGAHIGPGAHLAGEVFVGRAAFIGTGAVVLPRVHIGEGAIVGAGAVVTRNVAERTVVIGNPARSR